MKKILFIGLCSVATNVWALEARLSPNPIMQGESTELILSSDQPFSVPENLNELTQNFMLAGQQQRQSSRFVNGVGSTTYELAFVLFPLRQGDLTLPSLKVGNEKTTPLTLKVLDKKQNQVNQNLPPLELSASVSDAKPYVGQTLFYTLTLTDGQGIVDGEMIPAQANGIKLSQIGQDKANSVLKNGQRVNEIERTYTLIPDQTGKIEIPPALFNGQVAYRAARPTNKNKFFGIADAEMLFGNFFNATRPVSFTSNPITIDVQPKPAGIKGWWLPSTKVELNADYQIPDIIRVGDTLSGKLILTAQDVNANDMPVPRLTDSADFRIYPQPEERTTSIVNNHLQGRVSVAFMLIPLKVGQTEIPAVSVDWFNTTTKQQEKASVPARPLMVEQGSVAPIIGPTTQAPPTMPKPTATASLPTDSSPYAWLWIIAGILIGTAVGILSMLFWYHKKMNTTKKQKPLPDFYAFK